MITSSNNERVKHLATLLKKKKQRDTEGHFVTEGKKMYFELLKDFPGLLIETYWSESGLAALSKEERELAETAGYEVLSDSVFQKTAETVTPQGVLAVVKMPAYSLADFTDSDECRLILLERLQDPGNLGTILRTAEAAGMTGVILTEDSVDVFNPKVVRSTMGSIFRIPFYYVPSMPELLGKLKEKNIAVYAAHLEGSVTYDSVRYGSRYGIMIGNEANGLTEDSTALASQAVRIPMYGKAESLNAAIACAVLAYESRKSR